ncbi:hypothetical protein [Rhodoplanes sp.]|uniref:hypothetical protein n=1 Tax=Rhodoplanes sp. TaxID=1968906 RepID=UPI00345C3997
MIRIGGGAFAALCLVLTVLLGSGAPAVAQTASASGPVEPRSMTLRGRVGGGNLVTHLPVASATQQLYQALEGVGAPLGRMDSYGWRDLARRPTVHDFDAAMREAHRNGITPIILLEYEGSYQTLDPPQPIGSYDDWYAAGRAYAQRFRPDGDWGRENGVRGWGATIFTAINEPDVQATIPHAAYRDALAGLADGVHSVDRTLRVVPGGFATCNSHGDATLRGYGPAIAPLLQDGRLDGIDLHTYYNARWFPLTRGREFSAQGCFDRVKAALGLTRDVNFYATEFNIARVEDWSDPKLAASLFLTGLWDHLGVVKSDRRTSATVLAFPWNLGDTVRVDGPAYAMAEAENPWTPDPRAVVLRTVLQLAGDMRFTSLDPDRSGTYRLDGDDGLLLVWQNRPGWTDRPGRSWAVDLPDWARLAELWGFDGLLRVLPVHGGANSIDGLKDNETYMLRVRRRP